MTVQNLQYLNYKKEKKKVPCDIKYQYLTKQEVVKENTYKYSVDKLHCAITLAASPAGPR